MHIPRYWRTATREEMTRDGAPRRITAWGWSDSSLDAAGRMADERARRAAEASARPTSPSEYDYLDQPLREEIVETLPGEAGPAAVTAPHRGR